MASAFFFLVQSSSILAGHARMLSLLTFTILDEFITLFAGHAGVFAPLAFAILDEFIMILVLGFGFFIFFAVIAFFILV